MQRKLFLLCCWMFSTGAAASNCFNFAETYYQQMYCEIQASGNGAGLPSFLDFRRNNEQTQALLLKPHARKAGIPLEMPKAAQAVVTVTSSTPAIAENYRTLFSECAVVGLRIQCRSTSYQLVNNLPNSYLKPEALGETNTMNLPVFNGEIQNRQAVENYLQEAYLHYLRKMMEIGLGGSTLSYGKFSYLFADLNRKGFDFSGRFGVMYKYLKADKKRLSAPTRSSLPAGFELERCYPLTSLLVCDAGNNNLIFSAR